MPDERRHEPRQPFVCGIEGEPQRRGPKTAISGRVVNISESGLGIVADQQLAPQVVMSWRLLLPGLPSVPVLAQVRWVQAVPRVENSFRLGLKFLAR
jgi:hypothetical protein